VTSLPVNTFFRRLLEHVPPLRLQTVRDYGLYSGNQNSQIAEAREALGMPAACKEQEAKTWQEIFEESGYRETCRCPQCGATLVSHSEFKAGRGPPVIGPSLPNQTEAA